MDRFTPAVAPESDLLAGSQPGSGRWTPVHRRFAGLAARTPQALAVASGERRVGYGELAGWSRALARRLRSLGVGPEARVAVCLPRSPELVASVLAVLEAGGAYVALDPSSPRERLAFQLRDCGAAVLLAAPGAVADLGASLGLRCVFPREEAGGEAIAEPGPDVAPGNLAYVIYTSGSTGVPKGVEISHGSLTALVDWHVRAFGVTAADRGTLLAGVGFDASVWEMWPYLATGAALAVVPDEVRATPAALTAWLAAEGATVSFLPTPLAEAVLPLRWSGRTALRFLLTGGDRLHLPPPPSVPFTLVNNYGPTEATVVATSGEVPPGALDGLPPIGRPLPHARAAVVDERLLPVPAGTPGELLVGGAGLARGYLGRPDLTAERFVPDPFAQGKAGERLYRTGDLVRAGAGGELEFLGRIDDQVKIRGHRIELGEVEAALARHPGVREGVVTAWDDEDGGKRLVAYVVPDGPAPAPRELRELMLESLPDSMVPSGFVFLESLPYTSSGKVDRRALPEPSGAELAEPAELPSTPTEARLADLWSEVLRRGAVGVRDSFFELGGHSLLATRILARVADVFGVELPLRALLDAPTVAELAARIDAGSPSERLPLAPLAPEERTGLLPLSFAQEALWFLDRLQPGRPVYNVISRAALQGRLDVAALAGALGALLRRHESLRTRFPEVDGEPRQEVEPAARASAPGPLPVLDLSSLPAERRAAELDRLGRLEARRPFDFAQGPLCRAAVVRLGAEDWVVLFAVHHIVFDGWSEGVFWRELSALYAGKHSHPELPELAVQYADFAVWQRRRLAGPLLREQLDGWRERLAGLPALELPTDRPRPPRQRFQGGLRRWTLPAPLAAAARDLARREGATPFMALLAGFGAVLGVYSGQDDFAVGSPLAGRGASGLESLIGYFVNMLTLRLDLSGRPGLRQLLGRVREESLAAFSQPDVPFDLLVQELNPERDLSRNPLFQVAFQVVDEARPLPAFPGIAACSPDLHSGTSKFDLDVELEDRGGAVEGRCEYDLDLFDLATVDRLLGHFNALLAAALAEPDRPLDELSFLSGAERRQLLQWSGAERQAAPVSPFVPVHRLFEEQARRQPAAPAVGDLTYAELERRATLLALRLREMGVGPEVRTGVCLERSPDLVVSVLAVLKAGGAYVALDPSHPAERLAFQLEDSRVPVVVTRLELPGVRRVSPDEEPRTAVSLSGPEPLPPLPETLAYVIYTSGSTGRPKGVELTHGSLLNLVAWHVRAFGLASSDRSALVAGVGFDASVWEVWPALSVGASLRVVPEEVRASPEGVRGWLVEQGITATFLPTPLAEAVLALEWPRSEMRVLLTGGDRLHRAPSPSIPFALVNNYGPTEGTVVATSGTVEPAVAAVANAGRAPSIGRPIDGARAFVMDRGLRPVPPGVPGELLVGGAGLARGYVGRPDLTAESFVPDPAGDGGRLYRTGDLVRFLPGGELDFLGRIDHQVKVRGYRIETGEIETALARHPEVREAAVLVRDGSLVAYVSGEGEPGLAAFLGRSLPDYMIPAAFVRLPSLPLNASGKVDRQALARIAPPAPAEAGSFADPRFSDPVEELVASLWAEVLGRDVRPGDNFFHLGGHSLLATRVLSRLREAFGVELPLQALFESPTVSGLARAVAAARRGAGAVLPPLRPVPRGGLLPLSFPQQRLWFMDRLSPDSHTYNIPAAFALRGPLDVAALAGAVSGVVDRHEVLRTRFVELDGQPWQEILPAGMSALPFVDLAGLPLDIRERELARLGREEAERPFVLAHGPLLRARLVRLEQDEHVLLLTLHHIASDGWSEAILDRELSALYEGGYPHPELPELPVQYADFAVWQRSWPEEVLAGQVDWWTRRLTGLANLEVPTDRARPPVQTFRGETIEVAVPPALGEALRDLSRARRSTLFMTLLAAWQALFHRITGQMDVAVGSPVANRNRPEIEGLIGFFVNMLALRADCGGDPSFGELLERVRGTALEAYDHADVPFERLIDELGLERDLSRQALVQVMFSLHTPPPVPSLRGLETEPLHLYGAVAKFDLTLGLFDHGDRLDGWIEYSTDLFDRATVARLAGWFLRLLESAVEPGRRLSELALLSPAERHQLLGEWNDTAAPFPERTLMHQFFEAAADRGPGALAAVWNGKELTYAGLEERANRIAQLLRQRGTVRGTPVGVWMERSLDMVAGVLAVLKAGGYYVPLDPAWPADRVEAILRDTEAPAILTRSAHLGRVLEMQWRLPALAAVVCLDVETPEPAPEPVDAESVRAVFDLVSERAVDRVTAGGFVSSVTGLPFTDAEVDEYRDRVLSLAAPWIGPDKRVLEIGVGSGLLMWEIAPKVARFVGLDPSPLTQERNRARGMQVELPVGFAHEIEGWEEGSFDLVLIASTAQFFPGPLYLERVVRLAERLLAPGGAVVIADVPDARYPHKVLSVDEGFFLDLGATVHHRETGFDNELRFRYDVVLKQGELNVGEGLAPSRAGEGPDVPKTLRSVDLRPPGRGQAPPLHPSPSRRKELLTSWHVDRCPAERLPAVAAPEDLAYVIHTSGSTGQPKGIVVQHRPVANLIAWINPAFGLGPSDRVLFVTSLCFDLSVWDLFGVLAAGGCVHVASEEDLQDAERLMRILLEEPITIWDSAPAALVRLAPLFPSQPAAGSRLRRVMLSGDWIPVTLPDRVRAAFPHAEV
ncbi:MAG: amino acid adenylation domain-containing protein, partial [Thermoanaerobaculia bacterium]